MGKIVMQSTNNQFLAPSTLFTKDETMLTLSTIEGYVTTPKKWGHGYDSKLHLKVRLHFWRAKECGELLIYHYSQVHFDEVVLSVRVSSVSQIDVSKLFVFDIYGEQSTSLFKVGLRENIFLVSGSQSLQTCTDFASFQRPPGNTLLSILFVFLYFFIFPHLWM